MQATQETQDRNSVKPPAPAVSFIDKELAIINQSNDELDAKLAAANPVIKKSLEQIASQIPALTVISEVIFELKSDSYQSPGRPFHP